MPIILPPAAAALHHQFLSHAILMALMLVATFIDFDEKTIPDEITIPGTLVGLLLAAWWPDSHLPVARLNPLGALEYLPLLFTSTSTWQSSLNDIGGLALGLGTFVGWCLVLIPALFTLRRGWWKAIQFYFASMARGSAWWKMLLLAALGSVAITAVWQSDGAPWKGLLTALVGLGFGGCLVWAVRIGGSIALGKEAMGFGDVTLMAMIGAYLGWQPCLMIFFVSPFAALAIAIVQLVTTGRRDLPYGPYLCASAFVVILFWPWFWKNFQGIFAMGWFLPTILASCFVLMIALLTAWRMIERAVWR
jgi:prepilin signal peptidase PulO-like enzyme (type II secretory pathway)